VYDIGPKTSQEQVLLKDVVLEELASTSEVLLSLLNSFDRTAPSCQEIACAVLRGLDRCNLSIIVDLL
jgi:hypothetical protein